MSSNLAQYLARSPRYILQPHDNTLIRVAGPQQTPWEEGTQIHNVSLTGLIFSAPLDLCPLLSETIKIQFDPPGKPPMACFALVIRLHKIGSSTMLVAVKFVKLEMNQRLALAQALAQKLKEQPESSIFSDPQPKWKKHPVAFATVGALSLLWLALLGLFLFKS